MRVADSRGYSATTVAAVIAALVLLAWVNRFVQDDAFISFRYARNLVEGHGLTFNPGESVEGYTNFLWTLLIAAGITVGLDPVAWSYLLGLAFCAGTLWITWRLAADLSGSPDAGMAALLLLGTNYSFSAYATGGLETQMQAFLVVAAVWLSRAATRGTPSIGLLAAASAAYAAALMTRLDSAVCLLIPGLFTLWVVARGHGWARIDPVSVDGPVVGRGRTRGTDGLRGAGGTKGTGSRDTGDRGDGNVGRRDELIVGAHRGRRDTSIAARLAHVVALGLPGTLLVAPWLAWKLQFYGDILPNTFYVKVASAASVARGGHYVYRFFAAYWLLPVMALAVLAWQRKIVAVLSGRRPAQREQPPADRDHRPADGDQRPVEEGAGGAHEESFRRPWVMVLVAATAVWFFYVAGVGGDFMEFRFIVPVLPLVMVLGAWWIVELVADRRLRAAAVATLVIGSLFHAVTFWGVRDIESVGSLAIHMEPDGGDWDEVGRALGEHFEPDRGILIAVGPAGAIPYYSRLETLDMRGLVDPWVARNGIVVSTVPGHQRMARFEYLMERGVNLVIGHPQVVPRGIRLPRAFPLTSLAQFGLVDAFEDVVPEEARMLAIPMSDARWILALYLTPHPAIDAAIASDGWPTVPLDPDVRPF